MMPFLEQQVRLAKTWFTFINYFYYPVKKYNVTFSNNYLRTKLTIGYNAGLANTVDEVREYVYKLERNKDGNMTYANGFHISFLMT